MRCALWPLSRIAILLLLLLLPNPLLAAPPPPPPGFEDKPPLSDQDLAKKKENHYFTGLPLANYDPNTGFGAGVRVYLYENGVRKDPLFAYTPYRHRVFLQGFFTTKGVQFHWLDYDGPYLANSPYRLRSQVIYERQNSRPYFGIGEKTLQPLSFPGANHSFSHFSDYERAQLELRPDGTSYGRYDQHFFERPFWLLGIERTFLRGVLRPYFGLFFTHARVGDYTGKEARALDASGAETTAVSATTRLREDCLAGRIVGCSGGWDNGLRIALSLDTRDYEPDPNSGVFVDTAVDIGTSALGGRFAYARAMTALRVYVSPFPSWADLVIAGRAVYLVQSQGTPFFDLDIFPFTEDSRIGLGGARTLRGYKQDRFVGSVMALANLELRYTFVDFRLLNQRFAFLLVPFLDIGRPFDAVSHTRLSGWKRSQGAGLRIAWNQATILMIDYGFSTEDQGLYINFNHIF